WGLARMGALAGRRGETVQNCAAESARHTRAMGRLSGHSRGCAGVAGRAACAPPVLPGPAWWLARCAPAIASLSCSPRSSRGDGDGASAYADTEEEARESGTRVL